MPNPNFTVTVFTDCKDPNAVMRQELRYRSLFINADVKCRAISSTIEASGCIVDALDAITPRTSHLQYHHQFWPIPQHVIVGNIAPRDKNNYKNGAPFCYGFYKDKTLVIGTPEVFTLPCKYGLIENVYETDVADVCNSMNMHKDDIEFISNSQFRSLEYVPLLAFWISMVRKPIPAQKIIIKTDIFDHQVWWMDNFGNAKIVASKSDFTVGPFNQISSDGIRVCNLNDLESDFLPFYSRLKDVPSGQLGIIEGSSGYGDLRFLELVVKGGSAQKLLGLKFYDKVFESAVFAE